MPGYTPTVWAAGDTVTSAKLNKMEQGIADGYSSGGGLVINITVENDSATMDKTWQEIYDAYSTGQNVVIIERNEDEYGYSIYQNIINSVGCDTSDSSPTYIVEYRDSNFITTSASGYPQTSTTGGGDGGGGIK